MKRILLVFAVVLAAGCSSRPGENAEVINGAALKALGEIKSNLNYIDSIHTYLPREQWANANLEEKQSAIKGALLTVNSIGEINGELKTQFESLRKRSDVMVLYPDDAPEPTAIK